MSEKTQAPTPMIVTTPRSLFISSSENVKQHRQLLDNAAFQRGMQVALAEYIRVIVAISHGNDLTAPNADFAMQACFSKISGVHEFMEVINRLAEPFAPKPSTADKVESLKDN